jgi:hypothetical protein
MQPPSVSTALPQLLVAIEKEHRRLLRVRHLLPMVLHDVVEEVANGEGHGPSARNYQLSRTTGSATADTSALCRQSSTDLPVTLTT